MKFHKIMNSFFFMIENLIPKSKQLFINNEIRNIIKTLE